MYWPKEWPLKLMPRTKKDPWEYTVVEKPDKNMEDSHLDRFYKGSHAIFVENVPAKVTELDLKAWIRFGVEQDHPDLLERQEAVDKANRQLALIKHKHERLPFAHFEGTPEEQTRQRGDPTLARFSF